MLTTSGVSLATPLETKAAPSTELQNQTLLEKKSEQHRDLFIALKIAFIAAKTEIVKEDFSRENLARQLKKIVAITKAGIQRGLNETMLSKLNEELEKPYANLSARKKALFTDLLALYFKKSNDVEVLHPLLLAWSTKKITETQKPLEETLASEAKHFTSYQQEAKRGDAVAQYKLGRMLTLGRGCTKNENEGLDWMRQAAAKGHAAAQYYLSTKNKSINSIEQSLLLLKASDQGHAKAQLKVGAAQALAGDKNGVKLLEKAAKQGNGEAQYGLWTLLSAGRGSVCSKDKAKAFIWLQRAAKQGHAQAQLTLGRKLANEKLSKESEEEGFNWICKAAEQDLASAQLLLAILLKEGRLYCTKDEVAAFAWLRRAAEQGDAQAQGQLGIFLEMGIGTAKDEKEAALWFRKAAEGGDCRARVCLGNYLLKGRGGCTKDEKMAVDWYRKAAMQGNTEAQDNLGKCLLVGRGVAKDEKEAVGWIRKAAMEGSTKAQDNLGRCLLIGRGVAKDEKQGIMWIKKAANQGDEEALYSLGFCFQQGKGIAKNEKQALECFSKAAEKGFAKAQYCLAECFYYGWGCDKDEKQAAIWYRKAAEQGDIDAQCVLSFFLAHGIGSIADINQAIEWYRKGAEQGNAKAQDALGACFFYGIGVVKDEKQAVVWFRKAAVQNVGIAQASLAICYEQGIGIDKDEKQAFGWYQKAAQHNFPFSYVALADCFAKGVGVEKNEKKALNWYRKAAKAGDAVAQYKLAECLLKGSGVAKNEDEALAWYRKAAKQGDLAAQLFLVKHGDAKEQKTAAVVSEAPAIVEEKEAATDAVTVEDSVTTEETTADDTLAGAMPETIIEDASPTSPAREPISSLASEIGKQQLALETNQKTDSLVPAFSRHSLIASEQKKIATSSMPVKSKHQAKAELAKKLLNTTRDLYPDIAKTTDLRELTIWRNSALYFICAAMESSVQLKSRSNFPVNIARLIRAALWHGELYKYPGYDTPAHYKINKELFELITVLLPLMAKPMTEAVVRAELEKVQENNLIKEILNHTRIDHRTQREKTLDHSTAIHIEMRCYDSYRESGKLDELKNLIDYAQRYNTGRWDILCKAVPRYWVTLAGSHSDAINVRHKPFSEELSDVGSVTANGSAPRLII